jgi:hypothetical protein
MRANLSGGMKKTKPAHDIVTRHYCSLRLELKSWDTKGTNTQMKLDYKFGRNVVAKVLKERGRDWVADGQAQMIYAHNYGWDIYLSVANMLLKTGIGRWSGNEVVIEEEQDPVLMELNGKYKIKELKQLLDSKPERIPEYVARAMKRGPIAIVDKRLERGAEK